MTYINFFEKLSFAEVTISQSSSESSTITSQFIFFTLKEVSFYMFIML